MQNHELEIDKIGGAIAYNAPPRCDILCGKCWRRDSYNVARESVPLDEAKIRKAGEFFYSKGWRFIDLLVLCPSCVKK
jgi:hypothetical protein